MKMFEHFNFRQYFLQMLILIINFVKLFFETLQNENLEKIILQPSHTPRGSTPYFLSANRKAYLLKSPNPQGNHVKLIILRERAVQSCEEEVGPQGPTSSSRAAKG